MSRDLVKRWRKLAREWREAARDSDAAKAATEAAACKARADIYSQCAQSLEISIERREQREHAEGWGKP